MSVLPFPVAPQKVDPVFFTKADVSIGGQFTYHGRRETSLWRVVAIYTFPPPDRRVRSVASVQTLLDEVVLEREGFIPRNSRMGSQLHLLFGYLSYSAIWRLVP